MDDMLRDSGLKLLGRIPWGTHISQIYSSKDEFHLPASFIKAGLGNNEFCVWIYSQNTSSCEIASLIESQAGEIGGHIQRGQLVLMPYSDWYCNDDVSFNEVRLSAQVADLVKKALDSGYDGLRAVADTHWLDKCYYRDFSCYEGKINRLISELPILVLCQYDTEKINNAEFTDIIKNHSYNIIKVDKEHKVIKNTGLLVKSAQLGSSHEHYKSLLDSLPEAVIIHDCDRILYCNNAAADIASMDGPSDLVGKPIKALIASEAWESFQMQMERQLAGEPQPYRLPSLLVDRDGAIKDIETIAIAHPFREFPAVLCIMRDISYRREISVLENNLRAVFENDKMKADYFSNISHELRTPISIILTALQMLQMQYKTAQDSRLKYHNIIQQNCFRLLKLINNIIDSNKIDADLFAVHMVNCNIVDIVESIATSIMDYAQKKGISLSFTSDVKEKTIACDPNAMERILMNLISNALKFTPAGGHVRVGLTDQRDRVAISVADDGIGIPPEKQQMIFDRFRQAAQLHMRENEGSGIGLSLVKALAEKHNGTVSVASEAGRGSVFTVELPCVLLPEPAAPMGNLVELNRDSAAERIHIEFSDIYSISVR